MKKISILFATVALAAVSGGVILSQAAPARATMSVMHHHVHYDCPMGHESSDSPGTCSVCGMHLKKVVDPE